MDKLADWAEKQWVSTMKELEMFKRSYCFVRFSMKFIGYWEQSYNETSKKVIISSWAWIIICECVLDKTDNSV